MSLPVNLSSSPSSAALETLISSALLLKEAAQETLWPSRCAICDTPGTILCDRCQRNLDYIDHLKACPVCGAPHGKQLCTECNQFILDWKHLDHFPLDGCVSCVQLTPQTRRIVTCYKDRNERRLANCIAACMADCLPHTWHKNAALIPIPTRKSNQRNRGFDHLQLIAHALSERTSLPLIEALTANTRRDQRRLGGQDRLANMVGSFTLNPSQAPELLGYSRLIIVDDVLTTGATLFTAANVLRKASKISVSALQNVSFPPTTAIQDALMVSTRGIKEAPATPTGASCESNPLICGLTFARA